MVLVSIGMGCLSGEADLDLEAFSLAFKPVRTLLMEGVRIIVWEVPAGAAVCLKGGIGCRTTERVRLSGPC